MDVLRYGRPDMTPGLSSGLLKDVIESEGAGLVGDHAAGVTVLEVSSGGFREAGSCEVAGVTYAYTRDGDSLTITPALAASAEDGDPVLSLAPDGSVETAKVAVVDVDQDGDPEDDIWADIPGELAGFYPFGTDAAGAIVNVRDTAYGYEVASRPVDSPLLPSLYVLSPRGAASRSTSLAVAHASTVVVPLLARDAVFSTAEWTLNASGHLTYTGPPCVVSVTAALVWQGSNVGYRRASIRQSSLVESNTVGQINPDESASPARQSVSGLFALADGESLEVFARQTSSASLDVTTAEIRAAIVGYQ